jgi:hypothetical protein
LGVSAHPARADWEFTRWGMSLDEVLAIKGQQIMPAIFDRGLSRRHLDQLAEGYYAIGETHFKVGYLFDGAKRLSMVALSLELVWPGTADRVKSALINWYGNSPERSDRYPDWLQWRDVGTNNKIQFSYMRYIKVLEVLYEPIKVGGP